MIDRPSRSIVLSGNESDLEDCTLLLKPPHEPWAEWKDVYGGRRLILRTTELDSYADPQEARERALIMIQNLNGTLWAFWQVGPVECFGILEISADGRPVLRAFAEAGSYCIQGARLRPALQDESPTIAQRWYALTSKNDVVADMLLHLRGGANWFDLYKTFEDIRALCDGDLTSRAWCPPKSELARFTHTANYYRHALSHSAQKSPPQAPMPTAEAVEMIREMVSAYLREAAS